jgi:hypothetical protein
VDACHHGNGLRDDWPGGLEGYDPVLGQAVWHQLRLGSHYGITLEFQFGTNWAYYSHYVGDIFGAPLAIEGLMASFLESTFIGLFFLGGIAYRGPSI